MAFNRPGHFNIWTKVLQISDKEAEFIFSTGEDNSDLGKSGSYRLKRTKY